MRVPPALTVTAAHPLKTSSIFGADPLSIGRGGLQGDFPHAARSGGIEAAWEIGRLET